MAPALESFSIFSIWIVLRGVSLGTMISFHPSFKAMSAALSMRLDEIPLAILARAPIEQGDIIQAFNLKDPDATGEKKSCSSSNVMFLSFMLKSTPSSFPILRAVLVAQRKTLSDLERNNATFKPIMAPLAPVIPTK